MTVAHAGFYGALWRLTSLYTVLLLAATAIVVAARSSGSGSGVNAAGSP